MTSQFEIQISSLSQKPGASLDLDRDFSVPDNFGTVVTQVKPGTPVSADLRIDSLREGLLVTGTFSADVVSDCVRCLDKVEDTVSVDVDELFEYPSGDNADLEEDELRLLTGDTIDLQPLLLDNLVSAFPFKPLCEPDCPGLCDGCGEKLAPGEEHEHEQLDPRWASLAHLREQLAAEEG